MENNFVLSPISLGNLSLMISEAVAIELAAYHKQLPNKEVELMSCKEVERFLGISNVTRINYTNAGLLKQYQIGKRKLYKKHEVLNALQAVEASA